MDIRMPGVDGLAATRAIREEEAAEGRPRTPIIAITADATAAQAADYLEKTVPMDRETALDEAAFFAAGPGQAITYQTGKLQIIRMLADARRQQGERFNLRAFHDFVWKNGNVPLSLQRWELLGDRSEVDRLAELR